MTNKKNIFCVSYENTTGVVLDTDPEFDIVVLSYAGNEYTGDLPVDHFINFKSECKGDLMLHVLNYIDTEYSTYDQVCVFDDDIDVNVSDINKMFRISDEHSLDLFSVTLSHDSSHSHKWTLTQAAGVRHVRWVEVMMPGFSKKFIDKLLPLYNAMYSDWNLKSGWGVDTQIFKNVLKYIGGHGAVIDDVVVKHSREITSNNKKYSNGFTAGMEQKIINRYIRDYLDKYLHNQSN